MPRETYSPTRQNLPNQGDLTMIKHVRVYSPAKLKQAGITQHIAGALYWVGKIHPTRAQVRKLNLEKALRKLEREQLTRAGRDYWGLTWRGAALLRQLET